MKKIFYLFALLLALPSITFASSTNGTIDSTDKYAWSENIGWINFGCDNCDVNITDSTITGYAWSANYGWINLNPSGSGISNNGEGTLTGQAWGKNIGWINFSGVTIDSSGYFGGYATGTRTGQISFNCSNTSSCGSSDFKIRTDWRPQSARAACNNSLDDDSDGLIDYLNDPGCSSASDTDETNVASFATSTSQRSSGSGQSTSNLNIGETKNIPQVGEQGINVLAYITSNIVFTVDNTISNNAIITDLNMNSGQISIELDDQKIKLNIGQEKETDLDGDGSSDIKIKYNKLVNNRIDLTFSKPEITTEKQLTDTKIQLVKEYGKSTVYKIEDGKKRPIFNGEVFENLGFSWDDVVEVNDLNSYEVGEILDQPKPNQKNKRIFKNGDLVKEFGDPKIYLIENNQKKWIINEEIFTSNHFSWNNIIEVDNLKDIDTGEMIGAQNKLTDKKHATTNIVFTRNLRLGDRGTDVKALQQFLNRTTNHKIANQGPGSLGQETEFFGRLTYEALKKYQETHKEKILTPLGLSNGTGIFGPSTRAFVNSL